MSPEQCEAVVLVLLSGRSASWEFGYAMGQGKKGYVIQLDKVEPELMYREATIIAHTDEIFDHFGEPPELEPRIQLTVTDVRNRLQKEGNQ